MAAWIGLCEVREYRLFLPFRQAKIGRLAMPSMPNQRVVHGRHRYEGLPHAVVCIILGVRILWRPQMFGQSALQLQFLLGLSSYETAVPMLHKLCAGRMVPARGALGSQYPVEVEEMLVGGRANGVPSIIMRRFLGPSK